MSVCLFVYQSVQCLLEIPYKQEQEEETEDEEEDENKYNVLVYMTFVHTLESIA